MILILIIVKIYIDSVVIYCTLKKTVLYHYLTLLKSYSMGYNISMQYLLLSITEILLTLKIYEYIVKHPVNSSIFLLL